MVQIVERSRFQNFDTTAQGQYGPERLRALRKVMGEYGVDIWLVPHGDQHLNEYPPAMAWRLAWLSGFTGSAGYCVVTQEDAIVFVDGRYTAQVAKQIDADHFSIGDLVNKPPHKWLAEWIREKSSEEASKDLRIGFDPWLTSITAKKHFEKALKDSSAKLVPTDNLIDLIWDDQPAPPDGKVIIQDLELCGVTAMDKIEKIKSGLKEAKGDYCLLSDLTSIAWLFNIRGSDTPHTPLVISYALINRNGLPDLFIDQNKLDFEVQAYLNQLANLHEYDQLAPELGKKIAQSTLLADHSSTSVAIADIVSDHDGKLQNSPDPVTLPKATKNTAEIEGSKNAHLRDGIAVSRFLFWLDQQEAGTTDEITATKTLEDYRASTARKFNSELKDISFDTISGAGANGAIIHYRVTHDTNADLKPNSLYLVDSGGQYPDGTTDITRTVAIGKPPELAVTDYTLVLKGHIAIALARFPEGTRGIDIDGFARSALWQHGRDFAHGTGHGIGSYLSVHEGPQSISRRGMVELAPGMIISNEPGFYREGDWGIRLENLVLVKGPEEIEHGNVAVMGFETLSLAPFDPRLINPAMLDKSELHWLNAYHGWVRRQLSPHLDEQEREWLEQMTTPLIHELPAASA